MLDDIQKAAEWIYAHNDDASIEDFQLKLADFKKIGSPIKTRHNFYTEITIFMDQYLAFNGELNNKIQEAVQLNDEMRSSIMNLHSDMEKYTSDVKAAISQKQMHEDPGYDINDIHQKIDNYKKEVSKILTSSPPKAKEPEKNGKKEEGEKKENGEKKEEGEKKEVEDQEMKNEVKNDAEKKE